MSAVAMEASKLVRVLTRDTQQEWDYVEDSIDGRGSPVADQGYAFPNRPAKPAVAVFGQGSYAQSYTPEPGWQWGVFAMGVAFGAFISLVIICPMSAYLSQWP